MWLEKNHARSQGVWLIRFKKSSSRTPFDYADAVEEALCFGWIDSKPGKLDDARSMQWFAPRKSKSGWSKLNKERVAHMIAEGKMTPVGLAKIEAAKQNGAWASLDRIEALEIPADLERALAGRKNAAEYFDAFPRSVKRAILEWIQNAKRPETRAQRIAETATLAAENKRANQWTPKK